MDYELRCLLIEPVSEANDKIRWRRVGIARSPWFKKEGLSMIADYPRSTLELVWIWSGCRNENEMGTWQRARLEIFRWKETIHLSYDFDHLKTFRARWSIATPEEETSVEPIEVTPRQSPHPCTLSIFFSAVLSQTFAGTRPSNASVWSVSSKILPASLWVDDEFMGDLLSRWDWGRFKLVEIIIYLLSRHDSKKFLL
jgi:hypothetical protein